MAISSDEAGPPKKADVWRLRRTAQAKPWKDISVVQSWPRPRGRVKSARQQAWVDRFSLWACLTKSPDAQTYDQAKEWTKDSGWFWRDMLTAAMAGKLIETIGETKITTPTACYDRIAIDALVANVTESITFDTLRWDNNGFWAAAPNPTRFLIKSPGLYLMGAECNFENSATDGSRALSLRLNGTDIFANSRAQDIANQDVILQTGAVWYFRAMDYIEARVVSTVTSQVNNARLWIVAITPETIIP